jgi:hypothetical protein
VKRTGHPRKVDPRSSRWFAARAVLLAVLLAGLLSVDVAEVLGQNVNTPPPTTFVNTALGGFILGYDIDPNGNVGVLSEALALSDGKANVATEFFDQTTGQITKILAQQNDTLNDFVTQGVFGNGIGLIEFEKAKGIFVGKRFYRTINPLSGEQITGTWTPPLNNSQLIMGIAEAQAGSNTALLVSENINTFVLSTDIAKNTFGSPIQLTNPVFANTPVIAVNPLTNHAIVAATQGGLFGTPMFADVDLTSGQVSEFNGLGFGLVNGIAIDPVNNIAVTTTETDFSIEFYDLATHTGFLVPLQGATNQAQSGSAVDFDPVHDLFFIGQEFSSIFPTGSSIHIYDEQGNFIKGINNLSLPASPAHMALNPSRRAGYVIVTPSLNQLQAFTY